MTLKCFDPLESVQRKQKMVLSWGKGKNAKKRSVRVVRAAPAKKALWIYYGKKSSKNVPRNGWRVSLTYKIKEEAEAAPPPQEEYQEAQQQEPREEKKEKKTSSSGSEWWPRNHRIELGYGFTIGSGTTFKSHFLDTRVILVPFNIPVALDTGLQWNFSKLTVATVKTTTFAVQIPIFLRFEPIVAPWFSPALGLGASVLGFSYGDSSVETTTSVFNNATIDMFLQTNFHFGKHKLYFRMQQTKIQKLAKINTKIFFLGYGFDLDL